MRALQKRDYEKLAQEVLDGFLEGGTPLVNGVAKVAMDAGLNPEQIRNLVQLANTMTHLALFDRKADGDKNVEFDPADPTTVLKKVYSDGEVPDTPSADPAPQSASGLLDMFGDFPDLKGILGKGSPAAASPCESGCPASGPSGPGEPSELGAAAPADPAKQQMLIIKIRKVAQHLNGKKLAALCEYRETMDKLATEFAKMYGPDFREFEKDAADVFGIAAMTPLSDIRNCLRLDEPTKDLFEKRARLVDTNTPEMGMFRSMVENIKLAQHCADGEQYLHEEVGGLL